MVCASIRTVTFALGLALMGAGCSHASAQSGPATAEPADPSAELRRDNATLRRRVQMLEDRMLRVERGALPATATAKRAREPQPEREVRAYKVQPETAAAGPTQAEDEPVDAGYTLGELQPREYQDEALWDDPSGLAVAAEPDQEPSAAPGTSYRLVGDELVQMTQPGRAKVADKPMRGRKGRSAKARYTNALALLRVGQHDEAAEAFADFVATFPKSDLADNAMYWRGEAYYDQGHYADALAAFTAVIELYAGGNKASDALLKVGLCYGKLGDADNARDVLNRLIEAYPGASASDVARVKLAELSS